jgi:hypothetical protein
LEKSGAIGNLQRMETMSDNFPAPDGKSNWRDRPQLQRRRRLMSRPDGYAHFFRDEVMRATRRISQIQRDSRCYPSMRQIVTSHMGLAYFSGRR